MKLSEFINENASNIDVSRWPEVNYLWITGRNYVDNKSLNFCIMDTNELGCIHIKTNPLIGWESPSYVYIPNTINVHCNEIKENLERYFPKWLEIFKIENEVITLNTKKEEVNEVILDVINQQEQSKRNKFSPIIFGF